MRKKRKTPWNFAGTNNSFLCAVQIVSMGEAETPRLLCYWDISVRDRIDPMGCFSLKSSLSKAQSASILMKYTSHMTPRYRIHICNSCHRLDCAYIRLTKEMQRKLHDSAWLSFNLHSLSSVTLLEMGSSSLVVSSKNLIWSFSS